MRYYKAKRVDLLDRGNITCRIFRTHYLYALLEICCAARCTPCDVDKFIGAIPLGRYGSGLGFFSFVSSFVVVEMLIGAGAPCGCMAYFPPLIATPKRTTVWRSTDTNRRLLGSGPTIPFFSYCLGFPTQYESGAYYYRVDSDVTRPLLHTDSRVSS